MPYAKILDINDSNLKLAAEFLKQGCLVAFPTETVYGLGADATNKSAILKIFEAKHRPRNHPLIVHIADLDEINYWTCDFHKIAQKLAQNFWPGPMTLILPKSLNVLEEISGNDSIAIRIPANEIALKLIKFLGCGIAAPSANKFGKTSTTNAQDVFDELKDKVSIILNSNTNCDIGLESTIINLFQKPYNIVRPGYVKISDIQNVLEQNELAQFDFESSIEHIKASGNLESHYQPNCKLYLVDDLNNFQFDNQLNYGIITFNDRVCEQANTIVQKVARDPKVYGQKLYSMIRYLDSCNVDIILVETPPNNEQWFAIRDRLNKARHKLSN